MNCMIALCTYYWLHAAELLLRELSCLKREVEIWVHNVIRHAMVVAVRPYTYYYTIRNVPSDR